VSTTGSLSLFWCPDSRLSLPYALQLVGAPCLLNLFVCPDLTFTLCCSESECSPSLGLVWCPDLPLPLCSRWCVPHAQLVSCPDTSFPLHSSGSECLACLVCFCDLTCPPPFCALQEVSVPLLLGLLTHPSLCALQFVSASCPLSFFACPNLCFPLHSPGSECPSLSWFVSVS